MPEVHVAVAQQLPDFVDLEFARRLEMAETILPDCVEALRRYGPSMPVAAKKLPEAWLSSEAWTIPPTRS